MAEFSEIDVAADQQKMGSREKVKYEGIFGPPNVMVETYNLNRENSKASLNLLLSQKVEK